MSEAMKYKIKNVSTKWQADSGKASLQIVTANGLVWIGISEKHGGRQVSKSMIGHEIPLEIWEYQEKYYGKLVGQTSQQAPRQAAQATNGDGGDRNSSIERQCCLKAAVELLKDVQDNRAMDADTVVMVANVFYKWVSGEKQAVPEPDYDGQDETPPDEDPPF